MRGNGSYNGQLIPTQKAKSQCQNVCNGMSDNNETNSGNGGGSSRNNQSWKNKGKTLKGQCSELEGSIIDVNGNNVSQCNETIKTMLNCIGRECQQGFHVKKSLQNLELELDKPEAPDDDLEEDDIEHQIHQEEMRNHVKERRKCRENMRQAHNLIIGQCGQAVEVKIRSFPEHDEAEKTEDSIGLLKTLNKLMHKQEDTRHHCETHVKTSVKLSLCGQGDKSPHQCLEEFKNAIEQAEGCGTEFGNEDKIRKNCEDCDSEDDEPGDMPENTAMEDWLDEMTLCQPAASANANPGLKNQAGLQETEEEMRALAKWANGTRLLADSTKHEMCAHTFLRMQTKNNMVN